MAFHCSNITISTSYQYLRFESSLVLSPDVNWNAEYVNIYKIWKFAVFLGGR